MQHIRSISDLNPQSVGFGNRAAESVNIIGHVLEDLLNGFGGALAAVTGQPHGSHLSQTITREINVFDEANPPPTPADQRRIDAVTRAVPKTFTIGFTSDTSRVQDFIDKRF